MKTTRSLVKRIFVAMTCWGLLTACSMQNKKPENTVLIAPLGEPPIESVVWSPVDQNLLLITASGMGPGMTEISILDLSTNEKNILARTENGDMWAETWLPDGKTVLMFASPDTIGFENGGYWLIDVVDHSLSYFGATGRQIWSPDGEMIARYTVGQDPETNSREIQIHLVNIDTNSDKVAFESDGEQRLFGFSWSPDSQNLVYSVGDYTASDLYVRNITTGVVMQITNGGNNDTPVWSPKGDFIAYTKADNGLMSSIHLIRPDGSCDVKLLDLDGVGSPSWSPDGGKLAFVSATGVYYLELDKLIRDSEQRTLCP